MMEEKLRQWQRGRIWLLCRFRKFVALEEKAKKANDAPQQSYNWEKRTQTWANIVRHEQRLDLKPEYIDEFTQIVLQKIKEGKGPDQIIEEIIKSNHHFP